MDFQSPIEQLFLTTTRIVAEKDGQFGIGTGFIFSYETKEGTAPFLVTSKHLVQGTKKGRFFLLQADADGKKPKLGEAVNVEVDQFESRWFGHPKDEVDVTVMPLVPILQELEKAGNRVFFRSLSTELVPKPEGWESLTPVEEVMLFDYPSGMVDTKSLLPTARRAHTASPASLEFGGGPLFMLQGTMFPCTAGTPVFLCNPSGYVGRQGFVPEVRILLLGVLSQVGLRGPQGEMEFGLIPNGPLPPTINRQITDLGIAFRSTTIVEAIEAFLQKIEELRQSAAQEENHGALAGK